MIHFKVYPLSTIVLLCRLHGVSCVGHGDGSGGVFPELAVARRITVDDREGDFFQTGEEFLRAHVRFKGGKLRNEIGGCHVAWIRHVASFRAHSAL